MILEFLVVNLKIEFLFVIRKLIRFIFSGLDSGNEFVRFFEGCGGVYFMFDSVGEEYIFVFKLVDEELMVVNNFKGLF